MEETKEVIVKKKKKLSKSGIVLIVGIAIIAIPCLVFVGILGISALQTGSPREGNRFKNDLVNEITKNDVSNIESDLNGLSNVESVLVKVSEGQLKIYIDTNDSVSVEQFDEIVSKAYEKVISRLPISTYFTKTDTVKNYDLQINVYTTAEDSVNRQYKLLHKNAAEEAYQIDDLVHPKDQALADELLGKKPTSDSELEDGETDE